MTVRVNKSSFNIREKLSELGRKFGLKGSELVAAETAQEAGALLGVGRRNFIMNPKFDIDQRFGGSTINNTVGSKKLMDRWSTYTNLNNHSSNYDIVNDGPIDAGIYRSVRITAAAASTYSTNQEYQFRQKFEGYDIKRFGWGTSGAKYSTVSFWVKSSIAGKYGVTAFFFGASGADRRFVGEYHINSANTWEYKTVTIPPLTESINQVNYEANASGMLMWSLGAHPNYEGASGIWYSSYKMAPTGSVPFFATNGATFYLTGVQWELGKVATQLEHRSYGEELSLCQRYYQKMYFNNSDYPFGYCYTYQQAASACAVPLAAPMRTSSPDINFSTLRIRGYNQDGSNGSQAITSASGETQESHALLQLNLGHTNVPSAAVGASSVLTNGISNSNSYLEIDAEL